MKTRLTFLTVCGMAVALLTLGFASSPAMAEVPGVEEVDLAGIKVCIDPGHGGEDPGAINVDQDPDLRESDINLDVSLALKSLLTQAGADAVLTREDDSYLTNADRYTFCNAEEATILVSVHTNSVTYPDWDGSMTLYAPSAERTLAEAIHPVMYEFLHSTAPQDVDFRDFGLDNFASGVLFKCDMPAAMVEPLFMSNPDEAALLLTTIAGDQCENLGCRRGQIAQAVFAGILNYFGQVGPPPPPEGTTHVGGIDMSYQKRGPNIFVYTTVAVHDADGSPVSGATVFVGTELPGGVTVSSSGLTGDDGSVTLSLRASETGAYTSTVTDVTRPGWVYDPASNDADSATLTVP
jgi:N-acetylmuramoyl-L-alanine amidase